MNVPHPGYKSEKPLIKPIARMYKELGDQDACIQLQELAVRYLERTVADLGDGAHEFLRGLYRDSDVPHGSHSFSEMSAVASRSYLLVTYALFEKMIKGCIREYRTRYPEISPKWTDQQNGEQLSPLQRLAANALPRHKRQLVTPSEYKLLEYYRIVRNSGTHVDAKSAEKATKAFSAFSAADIAHFREYAKISSAPNLPEQISFEDFRLFTRSIKYYSNILNDVCGDEA